MPWYAAGSGNRLWYEDLGTGTPLVLIHGWCMSSAVWRFQFEGLADTFRIIAIDLPGHGKSTVGPDGFCRDNCSAALAGLFDDLGLQNALLVGWSLGSMLAVDSFTLLKARLSGLVLVAGTPRFTQCADFPYGLSAVDVAGMANKVQRSPRRALEGFTRRMFVADELSEPLLETCVREIIASIPLPATEVALQALHVLENIDVRELLALIDLPTLILSGENDQICLPQASDFLAQEIVSSRQKIFRGCGHAPFLTQSSCFNVWLVEFQEELVSGH